MNKQEAIKTLREWRGRMANHGVPDFGEKYKALGMAIQALSVERTGEWKLWNEPGNEYVYCTKCKHAYDQIDLYIGGSEYPNFCPNCGAKMGGDE